MAQKTREEIIRDAEDEAYAEAFGMAAAGLISEDEIPAVALSIRREILERWGLGDED